MKNDLDWDDDVYEFYSTEKILATIAVIIYPRSMAGLNLNPNENETDFQSNQIETLLKRLCKKTYLMKAGWEIIRQLGPRRIYQPVKSICRFEKGIYSPLKFDIFKICYFHQYNLRVY